MPETNRESGDSQMPKQNFLDRHPRIDKVVSIGGLIALAASMQLMRIELRGRPDGDPYKEALRFADCFDALGGVVHPLNICFDERTKAKAQVPNEETDRI